MINKKANLSTAQQLANSYQRTVYVYTSPSGRVNIQFATDEIIQPYTCLHSVVEPQEVEP